MAELQSQTLNDVTLTTRVSNAEQIVQFVEDSIREVVISALSDIAQYESCEQVPLSAIFKSLWQLSRRSAWPEEEE